MQDNIQTEKSLELYNVAKAHLGALLSGDNSELGCAITVNSLAKMAWGHPIGGGASTTLLYESLQDETKYKSVTSPLPGDIIISPTGKAKDPAQHGHVGVVAQYGVLSNSSEDGRLHEQWTLPTWVDFYAVHLGFPVLFYRAI